jgi:hypothetical protein
VKQVGALDGMVEGGEIREIVQQEE